MVDKSEEQWEDNSTFSLFRISGEQRDWFAIKIYPIMDTFYFKILFFLICTSIVFISAITAAFIIIKFFEYVHKCLKASQQYLVCYKSSILPPSYSMVVKAEGEGLP